MNVSKFVVVTGATLILLSGLQTVRGQTTNAADDFQSYTTLNYGDNGGFGLGSLSYLEGTGGGVFLETGSRSIDGSKSMGMFSSTGGQAAYRALSTSLSLAEYDVSARFDVDNAVGFSGFNIKSGAGSTFGSFELLSFGLAPGTGNNAIFVGGSSNTNINLGSGIPGQIVDFRLLFDTTAGSYTLGAKFRADSSYTTVSGNLKFSGSPVADLGFANFNTGVNQNLILDGIAVVPEPSSIMLVGCGIVGAWFMRRRKA